MRPDGLRILSGCHRKCTAMRKVCFLEVRGRG